MKADKVILGKNCETSMDSERTGMNNNILVCGSTGCGKTMSISEPRILETVNSSLILTVTKQRLVTQYRKMMEERGYRVETLDFAKPVRGNCVYDPLHFVCGYSDIQFLARSVVKAQEHNPIAEKDPYWDEAAISLLCSEIAATMILQPSPTFADVLKMHARLQIFSSSSDTISTSLDAIFDSISERNPDSFAVNCFRSFQALPMRTAGCVFGTLNTALDNIFPQELRKAMEQGDQLDFEKLASRKTVLFVVTSAVNPASNVIVNLFYAQTFKSLFEFAEEQPAGRLPIPVHVLCDDFAVGGRIHQFAEYISIFREKLISVTLLLQSESQLSAMYGFGDATTIINNCDTYVYMGSMDVQTARNISVRADLPVSDILDLPIGQEIVFRRGHKPFRTERYDIRESPVYQRMLRQNAAEASGGFYEAGPAQRHEAFLKEIQRKPASFATEEKEQEEILYRDVDEKDLIELLSDTEFPMFRVNQG